MIYDKTLGNLFMILGIILLLICFFIAPVKGLESCNPSNISLNAFSITETSFKERWDNSVNNSFDVYKNSVLILPNYTLNQTLFTELKSNTPYQIMLVNGTCAYLQDVTTLKSNAENLECLTWFFIGILIAAIGFIFRSKIVILISLLFMLYGFVNNIAISTNYQVLIIYGLGLFMDIIFLIAV